MKPVVAVFQVWQSKSGFMLQQWCNQLSKCSDSLQKDGACQPCPRAVCLTCCWWRCSMVLWPVEADGEKSGYRSLRAGTDIWTLCSRDAK